MGRWTYYSPAWLAIVIVGLMNHVVRGWLPPLPEWQTWLAVAGVALGVAVQAQTLMVGAQGAFAQVLPVPGGRSIRGSGAAFGGWLVLLWVALSSIAMLLAYEEVTTAAVGLAIGAVVSLAGAIAAYVWGLPAAQADFAVGRRGD
jgi:hypothetical protein